jgi:hypothetical protein
MKVTNIYEEEFEVQVGDWVGFKSDIEQSGKVIRINSQWAVLENKDGFIGEYIGGDTITDVPTERLWKKG